jgi:hypothetical protein
MKHLSRARHLNEDDLVLHYYGERVPEAGEHLRGCAECRARFETLSAALRAVQSPLVPAAGSDYAAKVWGSIRARLESEAPKRRTFWSPRYAWAAGALTAAALVLIAFFAGRHYPASAPNAPTQAQSNAPSPAPSSATRDRVLLVALGDHLDRSQMLLIELTHAPTAKDVSIAPEQKRVGDLIAANRLYRQAALRNGDDKTAAVLDELERFLIEVAHRPSDLTEAQTERLRQQVESQGLLFKVRVIDSKVKKQFRAGAPAATSASTQRPTI